MKQTPKYFFGYLFVRLAKLLALLTGLCMLGYWALRTSMHVAAVKSAEYHADSALGMALDHVAEEMQFTQAEVGRITPVNDLQAISRTPVPTTSAAFDVTAAWLQAAQSRRNELKQRALAAYEKGVGALQQRIADTVHQIEQLRASSSPKPQDKPANTDTPAPPPPVPVRSALDEPTRTVFGEGSSPALKNARVVLNEASDYFTQLANKAEREESKKLIAGVLDELRKLSSWLPQDDTQRPAASPARTAVSDSQNPTPAPEEEPDQLQTAVATHRALGQMIERVRNFVASRWTVDTAISSAAALMESERDQARASEARVSAEIYSWLTNIGISLVIGLAAMFVILVLADFIQSFFDTASSAGKILAHLTGEPAPQAESKVKLSPTPPASAD